MYTNNKISEIEAGEKITITTATRKAKNLGINLTKEVKDLYSENYTTLKKEIKEGTNIWKHILCSWIGKINIIKMSILPPQKIYSFKSIPIKMPMAYFTDLEQILQKCIWNQKRLQIDLVILGKKNKFGGITISD